MNRTGSASTRQSLSDVVSVDVEDYFHLYIDRPESWDRFAPRLDRGNERILALLDRMGIRATFFVLGDAAARCPGAIRAIVAAGHELASHGYGHNLVYRLGRDGFREDVRRSRGTLEDIGGVRLEGFRASSFSVTPDTPWFWEILEAEGFRYSSSLHPVRNPLYGASVDAPLAPHRVPGTDIIEIPVVPARFLGHMLPFSGGFYLRFFPRRVLARAADSVRRRGHRVQWYIHTWEMDEDQPRLPLAPHWKFFRYFRLSSTERVLHDLVSGRTTCTVGEIAAAFRAGEEGADE